MRGFSPSVLSASLLVLALSFATSSVALAAGPFHCNGRIQFRPCTDAPATENSASAVQHVPHTSHAKQPLPGGKQPYVKIVEQSFKKLGPGRGIWQGKVQGNGTIRMKLRIVDVTTQAAVEERNMGSVTLNDKVTSFAFTSAIPRDFAWRWEIAAQAFSTPG